MDSLDTKKLTRAKLRRLRQMAASAGRRNPSDTAPDYELFDWLKPHHFARENLSCFESFARKIEKQVLITFENLCHGQFEVSAGAYEQNYACMLADQAQSEQQKHYFLPLHVMGKERAGMVSIAPHSAASLVGYMLRDPDFACGEERDLTKLEESILMDVIAAITDAVARVFSENGGPAVQKASRFVKGDWPIEYAGLEDLFTIAIVTTSETDSVELHYIFAAEALEPILGVQAKDGPAQTPNELRDRIMETISEAPIQVEARLARALISLHDLMRLRANDLVVLQRRIHEPIDVLLNNRACFKAYPARTATKYAVVIASQEAQ
ncbi:MAG: FliM/FliN family flagellar motor switch protein [Sedimentisphaerales bacterium]|nr:FliM/FliN family flagellar motor switch protein [Sedimentisphaerales bacterium]